ncbi:hypothetical protein ACNKHM_26215 [Shigella sonnei]
MIKITMLWQCKNIARIRLKSFKFTHATNIDLQNITLAIFQKLDYALGDGIVEHIAINHHHPIRVVKKSAVTFFEKFNAQYNISRNG